MRVPLGTLPTYLAADNLGGWLRARGYCIVRGQWVGGEVIVEVVTNDSQMSNLQRDVLAPVSEEGGADGVELLALRELRR